MAEEFPYVPPYAHVVFCEDIRHEQNGQATFVGVFRNHILNVAAHPPILIPQITAAVQIVLSKQDPLDSVEVRMKMGDEVIQEVTLTNELKVGLSKIESDPEMTRHYLSLEMKAVPLQITGPGKLLVSVLVNGSHLNHSALRFRFPEVPVSAD